MTAPPGIPGLTHPASGCGGRLRGERVAAQDAHGAEAQGLDAHEVLAGVVAHVQHLGRRYLLAPANQLEYGGDRLGEVVMAPASAQVSGAALLRGYNFAPPWCFCTSLATGAGEADGSSSSLFSKDVHPRWMQLGLLFRVCKTHLVS
jgi:hypothetical protein